MIEGERVRLKADTSLRHTHPELADAIGIVTSILTEQGGMLLHVRFDKPANVIVLNAIATQFEPAEAIEPRLRLV